MGGCASKPKELDTAVEAPISPEKPQLETAAQDNSKGGENQIEKPLVDLSESEEAEASSSEPKAVAAEPETVVVEAAKPTEDDVKAAAKKVDEDKVEVTDNNTTVEPVKEAKVDQESNATPSKEEVKSN